MITDHLYPGYFFQRNFILGIGRIEEAGEWMREEFYR